MRVKIHDQSHEFPHLSDALGVPQNLPQVPLLAGKGPGLEKS